MFSSPPTPRPSGSQLLQQEPAHAWKDVPGYERPAESSAVAEQS